MAEKSADDPTFGATKLNKLLFFADFMAYALLGRPVTGFEYQRLPYGPAARRLVPVQNAMIEDGELAIQEVRLRSGDFQKRPVNRRLPDLGVFTAAEISLVDDVLEELRHLNAGEVSRLSHRLLGWQAAKDGETIPYDTVFVSNEPLSEEEMLRGRELADRLGS